MSKTNRKTEAGAPITRADMEAAMERFQAQQLDKQAATARLNAALKQVHDSYTVELGTLDALIDEEFQVVKAWAEQNKPEFAKVRSIAMASGSLGYRICNPTLKLRSKKTWEDVLEALSEWPHFAGYIRTKREVNKEALIADRDALGDQLTQIGVRVTQTETFFVEANLLSSETSAKDTV